MRPMVNGRKELPIAFVDRINVIECATTTGLRG